jgi:hypothetical protein
MATGRRSNETRRVRRAPLRRGAAKNAIDQVIMRTDDLQRFGHAFHVWDL